MHATHFFLPEFRRPERFRQAMTHKSYVREQPVAGGGDNERLEFLGDAILTFLCGEYLYKRFPSFPEGELTRLRASLVDKSQLSKFAQQLALGEKLRLGRGVEQDGGRRNPRLLSSAFEGLIGAYFLDCGSNIEIVRAYVEPFFVDALARRAASAPANLNTKSQLQEWALDELGQLPQYEIVSESGPDHAKQFEAQVVVSGTVFGRGHGRKKQEAEKDAARDALERLGVLQRRK